MRLCLPRCSVPMGCPQIRALTRIGPCVLGCQIKDGRPVSRPSLIRNGHPLPGRLRMERQSKAHPLISAPIEKQKDECGPPRDGLSVSPPQGPRVCLPESTTSTWDYRLTEAAPRNGKTCSIRAQDSTLSPQLGTSTNLTRRPFSRQIGPRQRVVRRRNAARTWRDPGWLPAAWQWRLKQWRPGLPGSRIGKPLRCAARRRTR